MNDKEVNLLKKLMPPTMIQNNNQALRGSNNIHICNTQLQTHSPNQIIKKPSASKQ